MLIDQLKYKLKKPAHDTRYKTFWQFIHIDLALLIALILLSVAGLTILYSASGGSLKTTGSQFAHFVFGFFSYVFSGASAAYFIATRSTMDLWHGSLSFDCRAYHWSYW